MNQLSNFCYCFQFVVCLFILINLASSMDVEPRIGTNDTRCSEETRINVELVVAKIMTFGPNGRLFPDSPEILEKYCRY